MASNGFVKGKKCPKCGSKNTAEDREIGISFCQDCNEVWFPPEHDGA